ncbi:thioredoxin domain-containing protein [Streptomyces sp. NPDC026673]|uniref:DsbA family protein n=1 Tax=Streptomyces sp. NPDC026673 TaxID=3155724 RepID=UPI0033C43BEE
MKQTKSKRWRSYAGTVIVLGVVFGGSAVLGAHVRSEKQHEVKAPVGASGEEQLAVPVRPTKLPVTLTVYEDLRSPESKAFAAEYADTLAKLVATGQVEIDYRLVTPTDTADGGSGSLAAANAAACAQDVGRFQEYVAQVWDAQPADVQDDPFTGDTFLKDLAKKAGGVDETHFVPCVQGGDHDGWVRRSQEEFAAAGFTSAPVVQVNGETVTDPTGGASELTPARLTQLVDKAVAEVVDSTTATG